MRSVDRGKDGLGIELRKTATGTPPVSICSGSSVITKHGNGVAPGAPSRRYV